MADTTVSKSLSEDEVGDLVIMDTLAISLRRLPLNASDIWKTQIKDLHHFSWLVFLTYVSFNVVVWFMLHSMLLPLIILEVTSPSLYRFVNDFGFSIFNLLFVRHLAREAIGPWGDFRALERKLWGTFDLIPREFTSSIFVAAVVQALQRHELNFFQELLSGNGYTGAVKQLRFLGMFDPVIEKLLKSIRAHCFQNDDMWLSFFPPNEVCPPRGSSVDFSSDALDASLRLDMV
jgi:hypothetical protein